MQKIERSGAGNAIFNIEDILLCYAKYYGIMSVRGNKPCARGCPIKAGRGGTPAALRGAEMPAQLIDYILEQSGKRFFDERARGRGGR